MVYNKTSGQNAMLQEKGLYSELEGLKAAMEAASDENEDSADLCTQLEATLAGLR